MRLRFIPAVFVVFAAAMAKDAFDGVAPPFVAIMNQGDLIYDANNTFIFGASANFTTHNLELNQYLISRGRPSPFQTTLVLKDGHAIYMAQSSKVQARDPQTTAPDGTVLWLNYGQITLANVSTSLMGGGGFARTPSRVIIRTQAMTTGAKGSLVLLSYDSTANVATVMNHDTELNECLLYPGATTTGTATSLPVGALCTTTLGQQVGHPLMLPVPFGHL